LLAPAEALSDVLPPPEEHPGGLALSLEGVGSLEGWLSKQTSVSVWGGIGTVWGSPEGGGSWGGEIAAEIRAYFRDEQFTGPNIGGYLGFGMLSGDDDSTYLTVTPGLKLTFTAEMPSVPVLIEPYIGASYPLISDVEREEWWAPDTPLLTFGVRVVMRHLGVCGDDLRSQVPN
jgi:hypothetical protein